MMIEMPYVASCLNHEVQDRLAATLTEWVEHLNQRLEEQGKSLLAIDRAKSRCIEGYVNISGSLLREFPASQRDGEHLRASLVLNGIQIEIPVCFSSSETVSLMFIQADGEPYDGLAVHLWKPTPAPQESGQVAKESASEFSRDFRNKFQELLSSLRGYEPVKPEHPIPDWVISQPCFFPRLHGEFFSRLLATLHCFDSTLHVEEASGGFLPAPQYPIGIVSDFTAEMESLAEEYLAVVAD